MTARAVKLHAFLGSFLRDLSGRGAHPGHHGRLEWRLVLSILVDDIHEGAQRVSA